MSQYKVYLTPQAFKETKSLPGNIRQRAKRAIGGLTDDPRPSQSKALTVPDFDQELRRVRLDRWRIVYMVDEENKTVDVVAIRKRPPYDYSDLEAMLEDVR